MFVLTLSLIFAYLRFISHFCLTAIFCSLLQDVSVAFLCDFLVDVFMDMSYYAARPEPPRALKVSLPLHVKSFEYEFIEITGV